VPTIAETPRRGPCRGRSNRRSWSRCPRTSRRTPGTVPAARPGGRSGNRARAASAQTCRRGPGPRSGAGTWPRTSGTSGRPRTGRTAPPARRPPRPSRTDSRVGNSCTRSDRPVPRRSRRISREKDARRRKKWDRDGSSHANSMCETHPGTSTRSVLRTLAHHLVGDVDVAALRILRRRHHRHGCYQKLPCRTSRVQTACMLSFA
jgi:hypothetical protein